MPAVNWNIFAQLPGAAETNFEKLCRALIRRHYEQFGVFKELANQAGVEFHLALQKSCDLGEPPRWYGWQCKWYQSTSGQRLGAPRRAKILDGLEKTAKYLPDLTDWVLWTRFTLPKEDQTWFYGLQPTFPKFKLGLKTGADVEALLDGPAATLRETYFGELVVTPGVLAEQHELAAAPFKRRFVAEVHHAMPAEIRLRKHLGGQAAWEALPRLARALQAGAEAMLGEMASVPHLLHAQVVVFAAHGQETATLLDDVYTALGVGDLDATKQLLATEIRDPKRHRGLLAKLRAARAGCALTGANLLADLHAASSQIDELRESVVARVIAVLAAAGDGKSELAVQMTRPVDDLLGGVLLFGKELSAGQNLDHLANRILIAGKSVQTFERLIESLDAAGQRAGRRLPLVIDGLNEAEDPRNWKDSLDRAEILLRKYPYVLLVVTLRNEFAGDCLPDDTQKLELDGFKDDPQAAIDKYFAYYRIDATDADLPLELLQHPLTLRIYCDVANSGRQHMVGVEALPRSLTALFEEHFKRVAERVAELSPASHRIFQEEVQEALLSIAQILWEENVRSVEAKRVRTLIKDVADWGSSLLKSLESEGVLVRTSLQNGRFGVGFAYDLMAGHMLAKHLLVQDGIEQWLKDATNLSRLTPRAPTAHTLAYDTFHALVGLFPTYSPHRSQLWQAVPSPLSLHALLLTAKADPAHINRETVERFEQEILQSAPFAREAFPLLRVTRAANAHPFDAIFLDKVLRVMPNAGRDLTWSEWIRNHEDEILNDIRMLESRWQATAFDRREMSRAQWVMWTLTTTSRYVRDVSTKALYTLALRAPIGYFQLAIASLTVTDPYVPERAMAAAYGAALSTWSDKSAHDMRRALPIAATELLRSVFILGATAPTRHTLLREYCLGTIDLARRIDPSCIGSDEVNYLRPPFAHLPSPFSAPPTATVQQIEKADDAAISMDFGNYTFGRLIPDRANYDDTHPGYAAARAAIVGRMIELGYDPDLFQQIDRSVPSYARHHEKRKIDRYGKKYGWIAYFEMWGWRADNNLLPEWRSDQRTSDVNIDPSFPGEDKLWSPTLPDLFTDAPQRIADWIFRGPTPDYSSLLQPPQVDEVPGDWVLLNGFVQETAKSDYRQVFSFLRGVFVDKAKAKQLLATFSAMQYPGNDAIPDEPELHYTYAGEMPFGVPPGVATCPMSEEDSYGSSNKASVGLWQGRSVPVEIPVREYGWESYHSELNSASGAFLPSPKLCQHLGLGYRPEEWDLYDETGVASLYRRFGNQEAPLRGRLAYLRADILQRYLNDTNQLLVWLMWGERDQHYRGGSSHARELQHLYSEHKHIHKRSAVWQSKSKTPIGAPTTLEPAKRKPRTKREAS